MVYRVAHGTLVANEVATVAFDIDKEHIEVLGRDGASEIYFRVDGQDPTVGGEDCYVLPAVIGSVIVDAAGSSNAVVKLIAAGVTTYSVTGT